MVHSFLTVQEKRELLEELSESYRRGEIGPQTFRGRCKDAGIDDDDVSAIVYRYGNDNRANWRNR